MAGLDPQTFRVGSITRCRNAGWHGSEHDGLGPWYKFCYSIGGCRGGYPYSMEKEVSIAAFVAGVTD